MDSVLSDFDCMSESSSSEDQEDIESLYGGQASTIFSSLEKSLEKIDDLLLFERGFLHGDIVCLASDPSGQMGKVFNVDLTVDLENIYGCKIQDVNSRDLLKIRSVSVADYVTLGAWLGKVEKIVDCVMVLFDDGTKCQLTAEGPEKIIPLSQDLVDDPQYPFYPGQRVQIESPSASRSSRWLCGIRKDKQEQGTVCNVDAGLVYVDWLSCAVIGRERGPAPPCLQHAKNLSLLPCFTHANWQLGDWCILPTKQSFPGAASGLVKGRKQPDTLIQTRDLSPGFQQVAGIVKTKTKVDVQWQDGSQSWGLDSHLLLPVNIIDAHDFWPDAFVLEKGMVDDSQGAGSQKWGVVRSVDPKERTVKVKWCKSTPDLFDSVEEQMEEIVSAYELVEHPDFSCCLGDAVFRAAESIIELTDGNCETNELKTIENGVYLNEHLTRISSYFGTVVGFKCGQIEVKWTTGGTTKVAPNEIYKVDKSESTTASAFGDENVQQPNEEPPVKNQLLGQKLKDDLDLKYDNANGSSSHSISQVAMGVFTNISSGLFGSLCTSLIGGYACASEGGHIPGPPPEKEALELFNLNLGDQLQMADDLEMPEKIKIKEASKHIMLPSSSKQPESFRQFDMVNDSSDHHFVHESWMDLQSLLVKGGWLKKVHHEWSILKKDLPENIYVRVYEERMDLLRAAIVGTAGTPYHDGLFFFDIYLPLQYPSEPPIVYYNSGGLRINPNLYESGKVCLSLLNTWTGSQTEVWNPGSSTLLQVLLSLQALVLNEKPYFNEAGYDAQIGQAEGEKNSISYNENAFLVSCRSMLYLLRKPPKHFEALVDEHFSQRCRNILLACKAYIQGAPIGHPFNRRNDQQEIKKGCSTGFKIMLTKLYPKLIEAFSEKGFYCSDLSDQVS